MLAEAFQPMEGAEDGVVGVVRPAEAVVVGCAREVADILAVEVPSPRTGSRGSWDPDDGAVACRRSTAAGPDCPQG